MADQLAPTIRSAPTLAPPGRATIILNAKAGRGPSRATVGRRLQTLLHAHGWHTHLPELRPGQDPALLARAAVAQGHQLVIAGGGDGTISAVATALAGTATALGVLPLGTLNHFARDLQLPLDWEQAAHVILAGHTAQVDVGEVNGRVFINNSGLGLYPSLVFARQDLQRTGRGKWLALLWAALAVLRRLPVYSVRLFADRHQFACRTSLLFVGNNTYTWEGRRLGTRERLNAGHLSLFTARPTTGGGLLWLALRAITGRLRGSRDFDTRTLTDIWISTNRHRTRVSLDGEITVMHSPLHYRIRPAALRVVVPA